MEGHINCRNSKNFFHSRIRAQQLNKRHWECRQDLLTQADFSSDAKTIISAQGLRDRVVQTAIYAQGDYLEQGLTEMLHQAMGWLSLQANFWQFHSSKVLPALTAVIIDNEVIRLVCPLIELYRRSIGLNKQLSREMTVEFANVLHGLLIDAMEVHYQDLDPLKLLEGLKVIFITYENYVNVKFTHQDVSVILRWSILEKVEFAGHSVDYVACLFAVKSSQLPPNCLTLAGSIINSHGLSSDNESRHPLMRALLKILYTQSFLQIGLLKHVESYLCTLNQTDPSLEDVWVFGLIILYRQMYYTCEQVEGIILNCGQDVNRKVSKALEEIDL